MNRTTRPAATAVLWLALTIAVYILGMVILFTLPEPDTLFKPTLGIYIVLGVLCGCLMGCRTSLLGLIAGGGCAYLVIYFLGEWFAMWLYHHIADDRDIILILGLILRQRIVIAFFLCAALLAAAWVCWRRRRRA